MRIVIDFQGAQAVGSRNRGIGRYTRSLTQAIIRNRGEHEVLLALNGLFTDSIETIRADFEGLLPQKNICVWSAPGAISFRTADSYWRRKAAELVREAFLASLKPDVVLVTSLFEGLIDDAVASIGTLSLQVPTAMMLYDLIPLIHRHPYLENPENEAWYESKLAHLRRADLLLAISESSRQESIHYLGFPKEASVNVSTAADAQFHKLEIGAKEKAEILERYNLKRPYVLYTGGIDHRKNIDRLIRAYANLPEDIRRRHQLVVVCDIQAADKTWLEALAKRWRLKKDELVLTGFLPEDDLLAIYNLCKVFVFPSWHEGFGLPALEAMSCGRATIGSNTSSVPEVIGREDALFDPLSEASITASLQHVLTDDDFRRELEAHGLEQAKRFTWDKSAITAIKALEQLDARKQRQNDTMPIPVRRPKMAFLSPLPPCRSGISDYSAELLPELSRHYDIEVVAAQDIVSDSWVKTNCQVRNVEYFRSHASNYERVMYHFGNSEFHQHMFRLLDEIPGVVVLHDFFLSGVLAHMDQQGLTSSGWEKELYRSHGYGAMQERFHAADAADVIWKYPSNLSVLNAAQGIIVHSDNSRRLAEQWYQPDKVDDWAIIPHLRASAFESNRTKSRKALELGDKEYLVCSFGILGPHKLNHRLVEAWASSDLSKNNNCVLVFVGQSDQGAYGNKMHTAIKRHGLSKRVHITGWVDAETYHHYLAAADMGVQLRTLSRGETSGAVLDCMKFGLPTVVNANGSLADLPDDAAWKLADEFSNDQLINALEVLWRDAHRRQQLGERAQEIILHDHSPRACADKYFIAIENMCREAATNVGSLTRAIAQITPESANPEDFLLLAEAIARSIRPRFAPRQLLVDVSELVERDVRSGIQRVVRSILQEWLTHPPEGLRVEPVYATPQQGYRYACRFSLEFLSCPTEALDDEPIEYRPGDIFLGLDLQPQVVRNHRDFYQEMRRKGVAVHFVVYDLLCISMPHHFVEGASDLHRKWLDVVAESDGVICISRAVADELKVWLEKHAPQRLRPFNTTWFHLGADVGNSVPSCGLPDDAAQVLQAIRSRSSFLMVGTIEPRKSHAQTIAAFELLWAAGTDANLVIVGKEGWKVEKLIEKLQNHPQLWKRLFWLEGISDEYLEKVYAACACLVAASEGEGFGLPLIEAAQHKLAIIARDIPVFREVAGDNAFYFDGTDPASLANAIKEWLTLYKSNQQPRSDAISWLTWRESASQLAAALGTKGGKA